jgi:Ran GTPase-activating protein (RanGAP) involved in mRNA processing and transport
MNSIMERDIESLDLSHNAFGPDGVKSFQDFLSICPTLKVFNVTNCGLGPKGGEMIAEAMAKNTSMKLTEFYASRDRLEQEGLEALSKVFSKQKSLEIIEVYQNGSKEGLKYLLSAFVDCKDTLKSVNIQDNKSINKAIPELATFIKECKNLEYLNISDLKMTKSNCQLIQSAIIETICPTMKLQELEWNYDLAVSTSTA